MSEEKVWDTLASSWYNFRHWPIRIVKILSKEWKKGKILDIGCGNCRNLLPFYKKGFDCYGIDFSKEMIAFSKKYCLKHDMKVNLKKARAEELPFKSNSFDYCLLLASLHHLKSYNIRKKALLEVKRVLKNEGLALVTVWNKLQLRFLFKPKDYYVKWRKKNKTYLRYNYLFSYWELKRLIEESGFKILYKNMVRPSLIFIIQNKKF